MEKGKVRRGCKMLNPLKSTLINNVGFNKRAKDILGDALLDYLYQRFPVVEVVHADYKGEPMTAFVGVLGELGMLYIFLVFI